MYDIAIIGLGPAGAVLAEYLDSALSIIAIDKKCEDGTGFLKPCGGLLSKGAQKALAALQMPVPKDIISDPQIFAVKTVDLKQKLVRHYHRFYLNIDRQKFDRWLISRIPKTVQIESGTVCLDVKKIKNGYELIYLKDGIEKTVHARYVVGADGANSVVRRKLFPKKKIRQYISIQQWFLEENKPQYSCLFDSSLTNSYCWSISKDGYFILGGAFKPKNCCKKFESLKEKLKGLFYNFSEPVKTEACLVSAPRSPLQLCTGKGSAFLIGEAAGLISPSSLEGISYALISAEKLAKVLNKKNPTARQYKRSLFKLRVKLIFKMLKAPFLRLPLFRKLIMKSGLTSIAKLS